MYLFATNLASLVGIGVAVDYTLFILVRYQEEVRSGHAPATARARALATSGLAVVFSGATVIASLGAIWTVNSSALRSLALGAILVVAVSVLASTTLLPPLLRLLGKRAWQPGRLHCDSARRRAATDPVVLESWADRVARRPVPRSASARSCLLALAWPALALDIRSSVLGQLPQDHEARVGFERAANGARPGRSARPGCSYRLGPAREFRLRDGARAAELGRRLARDPAVASVGTSAAVGRRTRGPALRHPGTRANRRRRRRRSSRIGATTPDGPGRGMRGRGRRRARGAARLREPGQELDVADPALRAARLLPVLVAYCARSSSR